MALSSVRHAQDCDAPAPSTDSSELSTKGPYTAALAKNMASDQCHTMVNMQTAGKRPVYSCDIYDRHRMYCGLTAFCDVAMLMHKTAPGAVNLVYSQKTQNIACSTYMPAQIPECSRRTSI